MSIVQKLTEGIVNRDLAQEGAALISKWENTGLLEGLTDDTARNGMARLLENQAKELLRESSTMAGGDVEGFAAVAFPLVRRVFGSLIANDLVSVQPMSLPSGLIFFLDFTTSTTIGAGEAADNPRLGYPVPSSLYGGDVIGSQITGGVDLDGPFAEEGPYALNNGYSSPTGSSAALTPTVIASGTIGASGQLNALAGSTRTEESLCLFDPDLPSGSIVAVAQIPRSDLGPTDQFNFEDFVAVTIIQALSAGQQVRRLTRIDPEDPSQVLLTLTNTGSEDADELNAALAAVTAVSMPIVDNFIDGGALGSIEGDATWGLENNGNIPEIDIRIDSVAVTAITKKLKAKWTPELGQDLNAYHNLDAEVELTQILSEQVALEIDREVLEDLVNGAAAATRFWSRNPGEFLDRETGAISGVGEFTGNVSEWYETLIETINDVSANIHRKTLRGAANFCVVGPEVANILEFTAGFRANVTADSDKGDAGAVKVGSLSKKLDIIVDPYFPRNLILVGRRGSSFLESGYVYAPYVPLQTTPTIFGVEDFVPRKGVMTRYAKQMVRADMYGLVVVRGLM
tara:strand:- start:16481 stop:18193 length:1713 start_codon:yes stop_codon:yes gene_type:complete